MPQIAIRSIRVAFAAIALSFVMNSCGEISSAGGESHGAWASRMKATQYEAGGALEAVLSREGGDEEKNIIDVLERATKQRNNDGASRFDIFLFVHGHRPFWKGKHIDSEMWRIQQERIPQLTNVHINSWQSALKSHNDGQDVPTHAVIAMLIGTSSLFKYGSFDTNRSSTLLSRVTNLKRENVEKVGDALHVTNPESALLIADHDQAFSNSQLDAGEFASALAALSSKLPAPPQ